MQKEINKLLKRVNAEKLRNNNKECYELYNVIAGVYIDIGSYDEATHYHEKALEISKTLGDRLKTALCFRYIGEAKLGACQYSQAIHYIKKYLDLVQKEDNQVEIQRALTTLGRIHLMEAESMKESNNVIDERVKEIAREAEKRFQMALNLAESLREEVGEKEYLQMSSALLMNIGLIKDILGQHKESVQKFLRAIEMCKSAKLKEDLYRCQVVLSSIFRQKYNIKMATKISEEALITAKSIGQKILICDAYIERGLVKLWQRDFKEAKRSFAQAYLEKSPNEDDYIKAIKFTKIAHLISVTYDKIALNNEPTETRIKLCDKLGDLFVVVNCYKLAVEFYKRAYTDSRVCSRPKVELAKLLYSIAETYADDGQFELALVCYQKELNYRNGNDKEQCQSLIKVAHMREYLTQDPEMVCQAYEQALDKAGNEPKLAYNVLKDYVPYMKRKSFNLSRCVSLEERLLNLKSCPEIIAEIDDGEEEEEGDEESTNNFDEEVPNVDDVITDDEENDEVMMIGRRRARGTKKFKANEVGDTPLHEACIKGDLRRVKALLEQGHEVNPRDNAGWIPLHEACNHGHYEIVEYLIENGADVSNRGHKGTSPLHDAATNGHFEIMRLLIQNGANVIALTDAGETVLSCLRDYKKRYQSTMTNRKAIEYKHMETELMNLMDKCGFNLMDTKATPSASNFSHKPSTSSGSAFQPSQTPKPRARTSLASLVAEPISNPVKDYKSVIGTLKRKRINEEPKKAVDQASLPPTYSTDDNTSIATKDWLIDDVSRDKNILRKRSNLRELLESDDEEESGDEIQVIEQKDYHSAPLSPDLRSPSPAQSSPQLVSQPQPPTRSQIKSQTPPRSRSPPNLLTHTSMTNDLITVQIENSRLLVPNKEPDLATIGWLKDSIAERYHALHGVKPKLLLAPLDDPGCVYYDKDLCKDVIRSCIEATVVSWELEPISEVYQRTCCKLNIEPQSFIKSECKMIEHKGYLLDLSYTYWPKDHVKPAIEALAWRDFSVVNLSGATSMFDTDGDGVELLKTIATWKKATSITIKCVGLVRCHFERFCSALKLPGLRSLDLSYNGIAFKDKAEFKKNLEKLIQGCPKLRELDMRKNLLQFVASIPDYESSDFNLASALGLSSALGSDFKIVGVEDQKDCEVYSET